jgi:allantoicase
MNELPAASFTGLVDLAAEALGGRALSASDEFFAAKDNLLKPGRGVFVADKYTDQGKWMDGWESRRKRGPGHDHCIIALGAPGHVLGFDIDTNFFLGNHPPFAAVDGLWAEPRTPLHALEQQPWRELLAQVPLRPGSQNLFAAERGEPVTHVRLNIFPDGGVARFRVYGKVKPGSGQPPSDAETLAHVDSTACDLAALRNGALALACSDAFFGPMNNLLLPGRAADMGGGWETRRKRAPGHDWLLIKLAQRGRIALLELDTHHFKGNYPDRASVEVICAPGARITDLIASQAFLPLLAETKLSAHQRHFFGSQLLQPHPPVTHLRLNIFPDGGVSRLRAWGMPE